MKKEDKKEHEEEYEKGMRDQLTEISARQWDYLTRENLSPKQAVAFVLSGLELRTFSDNLRKLYDGSDLEQRLVRKLTEYSAQDPKPAKEDSVRRKVQNWMKNKNIPSDREELFRIAFALELNEQETETLLIRTVEQGIHYRNAKEVVYAFSLRNHQSYETACACTKAFEEFRKEAGQENAPMTGLLKMEFKNLPPGEDIMDFLLRHSSSFGNHHNTAYRYYMKMLDLLTGGSMEEEVYSMEYVADHYLRMHMPLDKKTASYSDMQKMIKKYWPGVRSIKAMRNRTEDVSRKSLLLLYLITGGIWDLEYHESDEEYLTSREILEGHCRRINQMMEECGMSPMDPRNPFDYLVLYCLKPLDDDDMSLRMEQIVQELFAC